MEKYMTMFKIIFKLDTKRILKNLYLYHTLVGLNDLGVFKHKTYNFLVDDEKFSIKLILRIKQ